MTVTMTVTVTVTMTVTVTDLDYCPISRLDRNSMSTDLGVCLVSSLKRNSISTGYLGVCLIVIYPVYVEEGGSEQTYFWKGS